MAFGLFITRNDIIKNTPLQGAIDADALLPFVKKCSAFYVCLWFYLMLYSIGWVYPYRAARTHDTGSWRKGTV